MDQPDPASRPAEVDDAQILAITRPHKNLLVQYCFRSLLGTFAAPIVIVPLYFKYHTLKYRLDQEGISVSWGILFRHEIHLTYKRIQDIHVSRSLVERYLGLGTVELQTAAGSSESEMSLEGLLEYDAVRDFLYRRMRGHELARPADAGALAPAEGAAGDELLALLRGMRDDLDAARRALEAKG
jgi:putative membrane protein